MAKKKAKKKVTKKKAKKQLGDDDVTLLLVHNDVKLANLEIESADADDELDDYLVIWAEKVTQYARSHQLNPRQKENLVTGLGILCQRTIIVWMRELSAMEAVPIAERISFQRDWIKFCRELCDAVGPSVHEGSVFDSKEWSDRYVDICGLSGLYYALELTQAEKLFKELKLEAAKDLLSNKVVSNDVIDALLAAVPEKPKDLITLEVAVKKYAVSRSTLKRAIDDDRLTSYRRKGCAKNAKHQVSEAAVGRLWPRI